MFNTVMSDLINDLLPQKVVTRCSNDHPWITDDFRDLIYQDNIISMQVTNRLLITIETK